MKYKYTLIILAIIAPVLTFSMAYAQKPETVETQKNATDAEVKNDYSSTTANMQDKSMSDAHRSAVAIFVQSLLDVADREDGIGEKVRDIAKSQNDSAMNAVSAIVEVDKRGFIRTFIFGSDYKNLGVIRSELVTTSGNVAQLKSLLDGTINDTDRAELNAQIQVLEAEQVRVRAYVTTNENIFSLFGWFVSYL